MKPAQGVIIFRGKKVGNEERFIRIPVVIGMCDVHLRLIRSGFAMSGNRGRVIWFAHVGGFVAGWVLIKGFEKKR